MSSLIAKILAIKANNIYIAEKGGASLETQHNTENGHRTDL